MAGFTSETANSAACLKITNFRKVQSRMGFAFLSTIATRFVTRQTCSFTSKTVTTRLFRFPCIEVKIGFIRSCCTCSKLNNCMPLIIHKPSCSSQMALFCSSSYDSFRSSFSSSFTFANAAVQVPRPGKPERFLECGKSTSS